MHFNNTPTPTIRGPAIDVMHYSLPVAASQCPFDCYPDAMEVIEVWAGLFKQQPNNGRLWIRNTDIIVIYNNI